MPCALLCIQNCCAEIIPFPGESLVYRIAGAEGQVDVKVTSPGEWGQVFPSHLPILSKFAGRVGGGLPPTNTHMHKHT
jgi:hypothetical protein